MHRAEYKWKLLQKGYNDKPYVYISISLLQSTIRFVLIVFWRTEPAASVVDLHVIANVVLVALAFVICPVSCFYDTASASIF